MTFALLKKAVLRLPENQRIRLANDLFSSIPPHREPATFEELERRADEVISGKVKTVSSREFDAGVDQLMGQFARKRKS